ncbi:MAG: protein-ER retention protein [Bathelium mastoideum]|nr:MAG: protein-ER retention protein [Bathelium mastoideum]
MEGDGDPIAEPKLDTFSLLLPLPYRVAIIIVFGVWAWGANLQYLSLVGIDVPSLVRYPTRTSATAPTHALSTHRLALLLTLPLSISLLLFWSLTQLDVPLTLAHPYLPTLTLMLILILFCLPTATLLPRNLTNTPYALSHTGRYRTLATLRRIAVGGLAHPADGKFGDILLADALTSYAKVLGDLVIVLCTLVFRGGGAGGVLPNRGCGGALLVPAVVALPSAIRLRQCLIEFVRVREAQRRHGWDAGRGWGGQHLANAAKYASAFPVVVLSALQREAVVEGRWIGEVGLFRLW